MLNLATQCLKKQFQEAKVTASEMNNINIVKGVINFYKALFIAV